jgi:hypothetical protein
MGSETDFQMPEKWLWPHLPEAMLRREGEDELNEGERRNNKSPKVGCAINTN